MGLVFKMMIPIIMILLVYGYMMGGHKVMDFLQNMPAREKGIEGIGNPVTDEDVTIYQWVDEKGVKHYSNTQPVGKSTDELRMSPNANVIQAVKAPEQEETRDSGGQVTSVLKSPYSPGGGKEMIDKTKELQNMMEQKFIDQQKILDEISGTKK